MRVLQVVPTVDGREQHMERWEASHRQAWSVVEANYALRSRRLHVETLVVRNEPTCAHAWNQGGEQARLEGFDVLYCSADDLEPAPTAMVEALAVLDRDRSPSPLIRTRSLDGPVESHGQRWGHQGVEGAADTMTRIPFLKAAWWPPQGIPEIHYWSDNAVSDWLWKIGVMIELSSGFLFAHHWATEGRHDGADERAQAERAEWVRWRTELFMLSGDQRGVEWSP